jgi:hypothetical protein
VVCPLEAEKENLKPNRKKSNSPWQTTWGPDCPAQEVETTAKIILEGKEQNRILKQPLRVGFKMAVSF